MDTVISSIKTKNKVIVGENHLDKLAIGVVVSPKKGVVGTVELTTARRMKKSRPSILSLEFHNISEVRYFIKALKGLRREMDKAATKAGISGSPEAHTQSHIATMLGLMSESNRIGRGLLAQIDEMRKDQNGAAK